MPHQVDEFLHHISLNNSATFSETGSGKTLSILAAIEFRFINDLIKRCLYVAPNSILEKIANEIYLDTNLTPLILHSSKRSKRIQLIEQDADIYIINYRALYFFEEFLKKKKFDCVVADEAHNIKDYKSQQSKALRSISKNAIYKIAATGTPLGNKPEDIFGIFKFLDESIFGKYVGAFRDKWCNRISIEFVKNGKPVSFNETRGLKSGVEESFFHQYSHAAIRHTKSKCLNLPPKIEEVRMLDMNADTKKRYNEFKKTGVIKVGNKEVQVIENAAVIAAKAGQICSGFMYYKDTESGIRKTNALKSTHKMKEMESLLGDRLDKKTVVWCKYSHSIKQLRQKFSHLNPQVQTSNNNNQKSRDIFQNNPNCKLIISQLSICDGYELTEADCAIYYELPYEYIVFKQSQDRVHRKGSEKHSQIMYYYLVTRGTVELSALHGLNERKNLSDIVTGDNIKEVLEGKYGGQATYGKQQITSS